MAVMRGIQRRLATGLNAVIVAVLVLGTVGVLIELTHQRRARVDLSAEGAATLSADLRSALELVQAKDAELKVTAFSAQRRTEEAWLRDRTVRDFLAELEHASARVSTRFVDFDRERLVAESFGVDRYGTIVVEARGDRVDLNEREVFRGRGAKKEGRLDFLGEEAVAAAVRQVLRDRSLVLYLLAGHGERTRFDRGIGELEELARLTDSQGWTARTLDLLRDAPPDTPPAVPSDAAAVLIVGPQAPLAPPEQQALTAYLGRGGSLAVFLEPTQEVPEFLAELGLTLVEGIAFDVVSYIPHRDRPLLRYGPHPITEELAVGNLATVAAYAGALEVAPVDGVRSADLLRTSRRGWVERGDEEPPSFTPEEDVEGPVVVATALQLTAPQPWMRSASSDARLVVAADVDVMEDTLIDEAPGNRTFIANTLRWLMRVDERFSRVGRAARPRRLKMTEENLRSVQGLVVGIVPMAVLLVGLLVWAWRRWR